MEQPRIWLSLVLLAALILLIPSGKRMAFAQEDNTESDFDRLLPRHHLRHHRPPSIRQHERHPDQQQQQQQLDVAEEETVVARRSFPNGNTNGCVSCAGRDLFLNFTKEELRVEILRKLGMRAPPGANYLCYRDQLCIFNIKFMKVVDWDKLEIKFLYFKSLCYFSNFI
jgi:hypothetical protein